MEMKNKIEKNQVYHLWTWYYSYLDTQICYVCKWPELLLIMLQLVNIDLDSFLRKNLSVYVAYT